jgi:AcrR family transcriptional regulator
MTEDNPGLRERKKWETRVALSHATIRLCLERGWDAVTVDDIAAAANVSPRTFRNYFAGKAEAVAAIHLGRAMRMGDDLRARPADEPLWDAIAGAVEAQYTVDAPTPDPAAARRWLNGLWELFAVPAVQGEILKADVAAREELARAIADRIGADVDRDLYPRLLAGVVGAASGTAIGHWLRNDLDGPVLPLLREALDRVRDGLTFPSPRGLLT